MQTFVLCCFDQSCGAFQNLSELLRQYFRQFFQTVLSGSSYTALILLRCSYALRSFSRIFGVTIWMAMTTRRITPLIALLIRESIFRATMILSITV